VVATDLLYYQIRNSRVAYEDARAWRNSFNVASGDSNDPVYGDSIHNMLHEAAKNQYKRIQLENHTWLLLFRILFGYIRPEL